ncbi:hypothetical protein ABW19_dt0205804 [Dactylella cylindrospora]|nr:hypothetical protein ABW19_dt0205804 [Dactylella cylindrospora]
MAAESRSIRDIRALRHCRGAQEYPEFDLTETAVMTRSRYALKRKRRSFEAAHKVFNITELLEHILSFVGPLDWNVEENEVRNCNEYSGFRDLWYSCRLVNKRWKSTIEISATLLRQTWQSKQDPDNPEKALIKAIIPSEHRPLERFSLCTPFLIWFTTRLTKLSGSYGTNQIMYQDIKEIFRDENFPNLFFTYPPVNEVRIAFNQTSGQRPFYPDYSWASREPYLRLAKCWSGPGGTPLNCVIALNHDGIRVTDVVEAFYWFTERRCNPVMPSILVNSRYSLEWISIGVVVRYDAPRGRFVGYVDHWATIFIGNKESFRVHDGAIREEKKRISQERETQEKIEDGDEDEDEDEDVDEDE